jgi:hypothetical protein
MLRSAANRPGRSGLFDLDDLSVASEECRIREHEVRREHAHQIETLISESDFLAYRGVTRAEALGIGYIAAYIQAAPAEVLRGPPGIEALDALGTFADRLAQRASSSVSPARAGETTLTAHLDVAARYGVKLADHERSGRLRSMGVVRRRHVAR